ncbi:hypothetical protein D3C71_1604950 [compost metagenome]
MRALEVHPYLITALILKAETYKAQYQKLDSADSKAKELVTLFNKEYKHIHEVGYRNMPEGMYLEWLVSLKTERKKYEDVRLTH